MSKAKIQQEYQVILRFPSGTERTWTVTDCYFDRRMEKIQREMLEQIQDNDRDMEFSMRTENPHQRDCPWHGVDLDNDDHCDQMDDTPCLCEKKYQVSLLRLEDNSVQRETFLATDRYAAVAKAFKYFAHKPQADCLDTWKVYDAKEIS